MAPTITSTGATCGAVVADVDLAALDDAAWSKIEAAFHEYGLLIFPGQDLSADAQISFGERFGAVEELAPGHKLVPISNLKPDGTVSKPEEHGSKVRRGNEGWHTDSSYMPLAAKASVFSAVTVPSAGGETEWADMRAAYDALDTETRQKIEGLSAYHSLYYSQAQIGHDVKQGASYGFHDAETPLRPLVKEHPVTGRRCLFIGRHAHGIPGLEKEESDRLLEELVDFACQEPRTYRHLWQPGDVVIWDNRCLLHRACPYDYTEPRVMRHVRIAGEASELALNTELQDNVGLTG